MDAELNKLDNIERQIDTMIVMHKQQLDFHAEKIQELITASHELIDKKRKILGIENGHQ